MIPIKDNFSSLPRYNTLYIILIMKKKDFWGAPNEISYFAKVKYEVHSIH